MQNIKSPRTYNLTVWKRKLGGSPLGVPSRYIFLFKYSRNKWLPETQFIILGNSLITQQTFIFAEMVWAVDMFVLKLAVLVAVLVAGVPRKL